MAYYYKSLEHTSAMSELYSKEIEHSVENSISFRQSRKVDFSIHPVNVNIVVEDLTTTNAILKYKGYAALNFASYKNPGGSFGRPVVHLAQEEYICKDSFLYNVISNEKFAQDYEWNKEHLNNGLYTNWCIFSKDVGFVNENNELLAKADILTCAAPNATEALNHYPQIEITNAMHRRIGFLLAVASRMGVKNIILGAFGCGVFGNDPFLVSLMFKWYLTHFNYGFENVVFAIPGGENYDKFKETFSTNEE